MQTSDFIRYSFDLLRNEDEASIAHFDQLMDALFSLFVKRIDNKEDQFKNERLYYINLLTQKFILHGFSIKKLVHGIKLKSPSNNIDISIIDPFSIQSLIRTLIETYLVQNYLSNSKNNEDTLDGRFEIWMRYGLKQRGIEPESEEEIKVDETDKRSIQILENSIKNRKFYLNLAEDKKSKFLKIIDREWKFIFEDDKFYNVSWKRLLNEAGMKEGIREQIYNYLSWHVHSQSISVLQVKDMWSKGFDKESIRISVNKLNMFIAFMTTDIVKSDKEFRNAYQQLEPDLKSIINFYNYSFRGSDYMIRE